MKLIEWEVNEDNYPEQIVIPEAQRKLAGRCRVNKNTVGVNRMNRLGIPQDRIAKRLGLARTSLHYHLAKMAALPNPPNSDLSQGFSVTQVAQKHGWTDPMVWALVLEDKEDQDRFKELGWGLRTWDQWDSNDCDKRFGDDRPGRIPAQLIAHFLFYFSSPDDVIFDPPYFNKRADDYDEKSISGLMATVLPFDTSINTEHFSREWFTFTIFFRPQYLICHQF